MAAKREKVFIDGKPIGIAFYDPEINLNEHSLETGLVVTHEGKVAYDISLNTDSEIAQEMRADPEEHKDGAFKFATLESGKEVVLSELTVGFSDKTLSLTDYISGWLRFHPDEAQTVTFEDAVQISHKRRQAFLESINQEVIKNVIHGEETSDSAIEKMKTARRAVRDPEVRAFGIVGAMIDGTAESELFEQQSPQVVRELIDYHNEITQSIGRQSSDGPTPPPLPSS